MRKIFALRSQGKSILGIATQLNSEGILTPRDYWYKLKGEPNPRKLSHKWSDVTVRGILSNEAYLGNMIQNKTGHISYKNKKLSCVPRRIGYGLTTHTSQSSTGKHGTEFRHCFRKR